MIGYASNLVCFLCGALSAIILICSRCTVSVSSHDDDGVSVPEDYVYITEINGRRIYRRKPDERIMTAEVVNQVFFMISSYPDTFPRGSYLAYTFYSTEGTKLDQRLNVFRLNDIYVAFDWIEVDHDE